MCSRERVCCARSRKCILCAEGVEWQGDLVTKCRSSKEMESDFLMIEEQGLDSNRSAQKSNLPREKECHHDESADTSELSCRVAENVL